MMQTWSLGSCISEAEHSKNKNEETDRPPTWKPVEFNLEITAKITGFSRNRVVITASGFTFLFLFLLRLIPGKIVNHRGVSFFLFKHLKNAFNQNVLRSFILGIVTSIWDLGHSSEKKNHLLLLGVFSLMNCFILVL